MPKSREKDRTEGYKKPEGESKTSESWPTISANKFKKQNINQRSNANESNVLWLKQDLNE